MRPDHAAFLTGGVAAVLLISSGVAYVFGSGPEFGSPLYGPIYNPASAVSWAASWGLTDPYRSEFLRGVGLAFAAGMLPALLAVRLRALYGPLAPIDAPRSSGGDAKALLASGHFATKGPGIILGRSGRSVVRDNGDGHVMVLGPSGSGKDVGVVVPTLLEHTGSVLAFDPKGEDARVTGRRRAAFGPVFVLNPTDPHGACFNPLLEIRDGPHLDGDCAAQATLLGMATVDKNQPFFDESATEILHALLIHVRTSAEPTLAHLARLVDGIKREVYPASSHPTTRSVLDALQADHNNMRRSIIKTLATKVRFMADPIVRAVTATSDFRAADFMANERPTTVFLTVPPADNERLAPLLRFILQALLAPLLRDERALPDGRPKRHRLLLMVNEFPQLGRMDVIERGLGVGRSFGIRACLVAQDPEQITSVYGQNEAITGNCQTLAMIPGFSPGYLERAPKWAGEIAVAMTSRNRQSGWKAPGTNESETRMGALNPRDMILRAREDILVYAAGAPSHVWLKRLRYFDERAYRGLHDG